MPRYKMLYIIKTDFRQRQNKSMHPRTLLQEKQVGRISPTTLEGNRNKLNIRLYIACAIPDVLFHSHFQSFSHFKVGEPYPTSKAGSLYAEPGYLQHSCSVSQS